MFTRRAGSDLPTGSSSQGTGSPTAGSPSSDKAPLPAIVAPSAPKGGGAVRSIGEKAAVNPLTGTASFSVPIRIPAGRGLTPELTFAYQSTTGKTSCGLGWELRVPFLSIARKTDRRLPEYGDSDTFLLDGQELVPCLMESGQGWIPEVIETPELRIQRFRPRDEGAFPRVEQRIETATGNEHWVVVTPDNITCVYGRSQEARIADPDDPSRIFTWLLEARWDSRGNFERYRYKAENTDGLSPSSLGHANLVDGTTRFSNRYLKRILYGNTTPYVPFQPYPEDDWCFAVVLDYGEHHPDGPTLEEIAPWPCRPDAFSSYRAGFLTWTARLCRRILVFHRFPALGPEPSLVRSIDLDYEENGRVSLLKSVTEVGYRRNQDGTYRKKQGLRHNLGYSAAELHDDIVEMDRMSLEGIPSTLDGSTYHWVDLYGEALPGILTRHSGALAYKRNLGLGWLDQAKVLKKQPAMVAQPAGRQQMVPLGGDGIQCLVEWDRQPIYHEWSGDDEHDQWAAGTALSSYPTIDYDDPTLLWIDLNGDGRPDIVKFTDHSITWYPSLGRGGFGAPRAAPLPRGEKTGPVLVFADRTCRIELADMTGDGLTDIVRVTNGEVAYWPNKGYGRFGDRVVMEGSPRFDRAELFDARLVYLADLDGLGVADLFYLGAHGLRIRRNQSGHSFSEAQTSPAFPGAEVSASLAVIDLLGQGTACLVWSAGEARPKMQYVDLCGGTKPYLLASIRNNQGLEIRMQYAPSTKFYLEDLATNRPWPTKVHFPVHVVERVETVDAVAKVRLVSTYKWHDGYYDPDEREFRGFGMVEQLDAESVSASRGKGLFPEVVVVNDEVPQPPVLTKIWSHTGWFRERMAAQVEKEYYTQDKLAPALPSTRFAVGLTPREAQEARRALAGKILRKEVYALDGSPAAKHPYVVEETCYEVRRLQPVQGEQRAVFFTFPRERLALHYERDPDDPRIAHTLNLEVDELGVVTRAVELVYPRRNPEYPEQAELKAVCSEVDVTHKTQHADWYRIGVPIEMRSYELTGLVPPPGFKLFTLDQMRQAAAQAEVIVFEQAPTPAKLEKRLFARSRIRYYDGASLPGPLPWGETDVLALPFERYALSFTPGLLAKLYGTRVTEEMLKEGGYVRLDAEAGVWVPSGKLIPDSAAFCLPVEAVDPFGHTTKVSYDSAKLLPVQTEDAAGNIIQAEHDYEALLPWLVIDANSNRTAAAYDELGVAVAIAVMGKEGGTDGDTLDKPTTEVDYSLDNWVKNGRPSYVKIRTRETYGDANTRWQISYRYFDGTGREVMTKVQAKPAPGATVERWIGTGRTLFNNKGNPVMKYEEYFSSTPDYEDDEALVMQGVTPILCYDPLDRLIQTDLPNGTCSRVAFTPWRQIAWDENDTVLDQGNLWFAARKPDAIPPASAEEQRAAVLAAKHAGTPMITELDTLGRPFVVIADKGGGTLQKTRTTLDIQGNPLVITDARGNQAMVQAFGMLGQKASAKCIDSGERRSLANVLGQPIRAWDSRGHVRRMVYDKLNRPVELWVKKNGGPEVLAERTVYGEGQPDDVALNLRGKPYKQYDGAGVVINEAFDFKGNVLQQSRRLTVKHKGQTDWSEGNAPALQSKVFTTTTACDALNRPTSVITPDQSETRFTYSIAGLLDRVEIRLRGSAMWKVFVDAIDHDAKGRRERIVYGNGVTTEYAYDPLTFRLAQLKTTRHSGATLLQDLRYTYDPAGNIVEIQDHAQKEVYWNNDLVKPYATYEYDALYRLIKATGREHAGQNADIQQDENGFPLVETPHPNDPQALRNYTEVYEYDGVGNILKMIHQVPGGKGGWTRRYEVEKQSNRLLSTSLPGDAEAAPYSAKYTHDAHGNMLSMPHLASVEWDFKDRMCEVDLGGGGKEYYVYDSAGQRVRKVWEHSGLIEEWTYLGGFEIYHKRVATSDEVLLERETLHVMDDAHRIALIETKTIDVEVPAFTPESRTRYQVDNHLGSAMLELDDGGFVISYEEYHPYGSTAYHAVASGVEVSAKRYRYTGKERDEETGLYYYGARYYAAWFGRWTSADPAGLEDGPNPYAYVRGNPIRFHDPTGAVVPDVPNPLWNALFRRSQVARQTGLSAGFLAPAPAAPAGGSQGGGSPGTAPFMVGGAAEKLPSVRFPPLRLAPPPPPPPPRMPVGGTGPGPAAAIAVGIVVLIAGAWYLKAKLGDDKDPGVSTPPPPPPPENPPDSAAIGVPQETGEQEKARTPVSPQSSTSAQAPSDVSAKPGTPPEGTSSIAPSAGTAGKVAQVRPLQEHHFATDKSKVYTPQMEAIIKKYGLKLDEPWNKEMLPHQGRHPTEYHQFVLLGMDRAAKEAGSDKEKFLTLFETYVKEPIRQNPDLLRKEGWQ